jgi:hypothetical protein
MQGLIVVFMRHALCAMPHAPCPMRNAQCAMPHAPCPMPKKIPCKFQG